MDKDLPVARATKTESAPTPKSAKSSKRKGRQAIPKAPKAVSKKVKETGTRDSPRSDTPQTSARPRRKTAKAINYAVDNFDDTSDFVAGVNVGPNSSVTTANDDVPYTSSVTPVENIPHSSTTTITAENIASNAPAAVTNESPVATANDNVPHTSSVTAVENIPHSSTTTITAENISSSAPTASNNEGPATVVSESLIGKRKSAEISQDTPDASLRRESSPTVKSEGARAPKRLKSSKSKSRQVVPNDESTILDEVKETEIGGSSTSSLARKSPEQEDRRSVDFLLNNKESYLVSDELKDWIMDWISSLTEDEQQELSKYLPDADCDMSGDIRAWDKDCPCLKHAYFWESVETFCELLGMGHFQRNNKDEEENEEEEEEASRFKDDEYESFYGEAWAKK
ncbi:unnamed protein product [Mucor hiemalis]